MLQRSVPRILAMLDDTLPHPAATVLLEPFQVDYGFATLFPGNDIRRNKNKLSIGAKQLTKKEKTNRQKKESQKVTYHYNKP